MIYALVHMTVTNPAALTEYRGQAGEALAKHGGKLEAVAPAPLKLEGGLTQPDVAGVLSFPDRESALAWMNDESLADLHKLRRSSGDSSIILVG